VVGPPCSLRRGRAAQQAPAMRISQHLRRGWERRTQHALRFAHPVLRAGQRRSSRGRPKQIPARSPLPRQPHHGNHSRGIFCHAVAIHVFVGRGRDRDVVLEVSFGVVGGRDTTRCGWKVLDTLKWLWAAYPPMASAPRRSAIRLTSAMATENPRAWPDRGRSSDRRGVFREPGLPGGALQGSPRRYEGPERRRERPAGRFAHDLRFRHRTGSSRPREGRVHPTRQELP
jgi:hypothetical protein